MAPESTPPDPREASLASPRASLPLAAAVPFSRLAEGARELLIEHNGQIYRLRVTRNDKLILSK